VKATIRKRNSVMPADPNVVPDESAISSNLSHVNVLAVSADRDAR